MIQFLPRGRIRFTFLTPTPGEVFLVGDFNDWNEVAHPMRREPDGRHTLELPLRPGEYDYKFKVGSLWFNDDYAHKYNPNPWGSENSAVVVPRPGESPRQAHHPIGWET